MFINICTHFSCRTKS